MARAAARAKTASAPPVTLEEAPADVKDHPQGPQRCLDIDIQRRPWWELQRWDKIYDEHSIWGDPSPETARVAAELIADKRMDT